MKPTVLVTDTLFISPKAEKKLTDAGFVVERLNNSHATEEEMIKAIKGKSAYIIGGMEAVTDKVIEAGDKLKHIAFTGADWVHFVPGHELATKKGIAITNTPGTTKYAVAEFGLTLLLMMLRNVLAFAKGIGKETFMTSKSLANTHIGIVGVGHIGGEMARMLTALGAAKVSYWDRNRKEDLEKKLGISYLPLEELFKQCDVITNHLASQAGELITADLINSTMDGVLFINVGARNSFNLDALYERIHSKKARAAYDTHGFNDARFDGLPANDWYVPNENTGFNTRQMLDLTDEMATTSVINVLTKGTDDRIVNL